jgi:hypothetical protein
VTLTTRIRRARGRLADIRGRRGKLRRALVFRHGRTLWWRARWRASRGQNLRARAKFRESRELGQKLRHTLAVVTKREKNAANKLRHLRKLKAQAHVNRNGLAVFDGRQVAGWMVPDLQWARAHGWRGHVVSGYRTPAYSEQLCYRMCGRPSCPGRCAGRNTNHARLGDGQGAIDVSDYYRFGALMRQRGSRLHNALGSRDPVHFSASGV